ncbi:MAG: hypothetical protein Q8M31_21285 [Beijerinckiaceae bacterium]|nr:hypothetical protein [Beijerinckiaceae bacterium]
MRYILGLVALLASAPASAADLMLCTVENIYEMSKQGAIQKDLKNASDIIGGKFKFDRASGFVDGQFIWREVKWTIVRRGNFNSSWILTSSDERLPLRFTLTIHTWMKGYPFMLYDVGIGDISSGSCH